MKEILNNEFASIYYDNASNAIITIWKKPTTSESYRDIFYFILEKVKEYSVDAMINDIFYQGLIATENRTWLQEEIIPQIYRSGVKKVAIIAPNDVFSRFYIESVKAGVQADTMDVEISYFQDLISAQAWLLNQEVPV